MVVGQLRRQREPVFQIDMEERCCGVFFSYLLQAHS